MKAPAQAGAFSIFGSYTGLRFNAKRMHYNSTVSPELLHAGLQMGEQPCHSPAVVEARTLKEGDNIEIHVGGPRSMAVVRKPHRDELIERLRAFRGRLPADFKFDRDAANGR